MKQKHIKSGKTPLLLAISNDVRIKREEGSSAKTLTNEEKECYYNLVKPERLSPASPATAFL